MAALKSEMCQPANGNFAFGMNDRATCKSLVTNGQPAPLEKGNWVLNITPDRTLDLGDLIAPAEQFVRRKNRAMTRKLNGNTGGCHDIPACEARVPADAPAGESVPDYCAARSVRSIEHWAR